MLSVYTRHHPDCPKKDDSTYRRCRCPKWLNGTLPGRKGRFRVSAKTKSWEQAELLARKKKFERGWPKTNSCCIRHPLHKQRVHMDTAKYHPTNGADFLVHGLAAYR